ncbi:MAG: hypothetical protein PHE96_04200 [Methylococcales bacterium]|nr:hypothetical protein [Methylococcales bacterium]
MHQELKHAGNVVLLRGAALWLLIALILAWCMVGVNFDLKLLKVIFSGKPARLLQAHLDLLIMSALIFGFYAAKVTLPWHVRWAMVVGAFTNSSLFLLMAIFPVLDKPEPDQSIFSAVFLVYTFASLVTTSYGFGKGAVIVLRSTFKARSSQD